LANEKRNRARPLFSSECAKKHPHLFLLPGPPRELQPMFRNSVLPILDEIIPQKSAHTCRTFRIACMGESLIERSNRRAFIEIKWC